MKRILTVLVVVYAVVSSAPPAAAGGATWSFDRDGYRPGDVVIARTGISWEHNPQLGTPDDGPYFAYIVPWPYLGPWMNIPANAEPVGQIATQLEPIEESPGWVTGPHGARVEFVLPNLEPGWYELLHCNDPCTTKLADITFGVFPVLHPDGSVPTTTTIPPAPPITELSTTTATTPAPPTIALDDAQVATARRDPSESNVPFLGGVLFGCSMLAIVAARLRHR
ncbi:MAG: hypothetical protein ACT4OX_04545 [Actinomycetota bacterium]